MRTVLNKTACKKLSGALISLFNKATSKPSGVVSLPIAGPVAAWMPPPSPHGRVNGVSRER
ncbi:hypothetical protein DZD52_20400 [Xanthomonas nasturtii]|uniref:Uncharacterized protein n=1 Tax=Xanthomonas nasturtii TaxID=1843581 RepID=A0A3E1KE61_9XANT|nr:hypothetical protein DZD52_20400 [Xanthomonas nasturtii]